jgi:hypothetical protein
MKVTLRDAFWFVAIVSTCLAWWADRQALLGRLGKAEVLAGSHSSSFLLRGLEDYFTGEGYNFQWSMSGKLTVTAASDTTNRITLVPIKRYHSHPQRDTR